MGKSLSKGVLKEDTERMALFLSEYTKLEKATTSHLVADADLYKRNDGGNGTIMVKRYQLKGNSSADFDQFHELIRIRKSMSERYLPRLIDYFFRIEGYCADYFFYYIAFEFSESTLQAELHNRALLPNNSQEQKV